MKKIAMATTCILLSIILCGCSQINIKSMRESETELTKTSTVATNTITIENNEFAPKVASVSANTKITFINIDNRAHQIASDPHPTHTDLPELNSGVLYKEESFSLVIDTPGEYKFHLEDNPSVGGMIIVN